MAEILGSIWLVNALKLTFLTSVGVVFYVYFGYPLLLAILSRIFPRPVSVGTDEPSICLIIAAYNEEKILSRKIEKALQLVYPRDRLQILVVSDGSADQTDELVKGYAPAGVRLVAIPRSGKVVALNRAAAEADADILVFSDANAMLKQDALQKLAQNFSDSTVGGVCGNLKHGSHERGTLTTSGESLYWKYDKWVKQQESRIGSIVGADGSLFGVRKCLFSPIANPAQADDFAISVQVVLQGARLVFETGAVAFEAPPSSSRQEFFRKARIANRSMRSILEIPQAMNPFRYGIFSLQLISHKVLRYLVPVFLIGALLANLLLIAESSLYWLSLGPQLFFYTLALAGLLLAQEERSKSVLVYGPFYFCLANLAALSGLISVIRGDRIVFWQPRAGAGPREKYLGGAT